MYRSKQAVWRGASAMLLCAALGVSGGAQEDSTEAAVTDSGNHHPHSEHAYAHHAVHHDFSNAEEWAARFDSPERAAWQKPDEVVALLAIEPGMSVVDLGAGTGFFLKHLSQAAGADGVVQALDPEVEMVRYMSQRAEREGLANVEARQIPFDDPELAEGSVDRILIVNTWHHIEEREAYSQKLYDALEPGGRVFIVDFTRDSPSGPPVAARLLPDQVIAELTAGGLEARVVEETLPRQYVVVGRRLRRPTTASERYSLLR